MGAETSSNQDTRGRIPGELTKNADGQDGWMHQSMLSGSDATMSFALPQVNMWASDNGNENGDDEDGEVVER